MYDALFDYLNCRRIPTGRRIFIVRQIRSEAEGLGASNIVASCDTALSHDDETMKDELLYRRVNSDTSSARGDARDIDRENDQVLGSMYRVARAQLVGPDDDPVAKAAREFLDEVFPNGLDAVVNQEFEEQLAAMETLLERFDGDLASHIQKLGLERQVAMLQKLVPAFEAELRIEDEVEITYAQLRKARREGHERLAAVVFEVLSTFPDSTDDHREKRRALLAEFERQNRLIAETYRRTRSLDDVDPNTGEPVGSDDEQETNAPEPV